MNHPMSDPVCDPVPGRTDIIDDFLRLHWLLRAVPALPLPSTSPTRAVLDYRHVIHAETARQSVAYAAGELARAFGARFTERTEPAGDGTPRFLLEAPLLSGLTLVIISRVTLGGEQDGHDGRLPEMAGVAA